VQNYQGPRVRGWERFERWRDVKQADVDAAFAHGLGLIGHGNLKVAMLVGIRDEVILEKLDSKTLHVNKLTSS
jgi:hypothetical protein